MLTGKMIRTAREAVGESQGEFAKRFGVTQSAVSDWELKGPPPRGPGAVALDREIGMIRAQNGKKRSRVSRETSPKTAP